MTDSPPSKTQRKKQMHALQDLGEDLVRLTDEQLASIDLPESLRDAVVEAQRIGGFEARRRQMQYIGKLMRGIDATPIRERIETYRSASRAGTARFQRIERWRSRLLEEDSALAAFVAEHPHADAAQLRTLVRDAHHERERGEPPRSFRALFKLIDRTLTAAE